jgi:ribosomal protein S18 acetylase RimI-like enzyme
MSEMGDKAGEADAVRLRPATADDIPAILRVTKAAYAPYTGRIDPPSSVWRETADGVRHYLERGGVIVAQAGDEVVGAVRYEPRDDHVYLGRLAVLPSWQRRGIGRRLIDAVEEWTVLLGLDEVRLSVRLELAENHVLYRRLGYVEDGLGSFTYDPSRNYLKMKKRLR